MDFCQKIVKFGMKFYKANELEPILKCIEPTIYKTPNNNTAIMSEAKSCILNNSGNKAVQALSLYNNVNKCLDPESLDSLADKLCDPLVKQNQPLIKKMKSTLADCKKNNKKTGAAKQEACAQKVYEVMLASMTKKYIDNQCIKLVNNNVTKQEWNCALQYTPQVFNISGFECSNIKK
ncbi:unnamed protein product [Caenorhabditis bovis]|uniref:DUF19 domain-containing protein n=1 Tax=Caenorhabditis bovis TaxID=2654633 RepID=A0A8S1EBM1_9PELO|nr:unnamed protein product [Caenorhabditis bovis]